MERRDILGNFAIIGFAKNKNNAPESNVVENKSDSECDMLNVYEKICSDYLVVFTCARNCLLIFLGLFDIFRDGLELFFFNYFIYVPLIQSYKDTTNDKENPRTCERYIVSGTRAKCY